MIVEEALKKLEGQKLFLFITATEVETHAFLKGLTKLSDEPIFSNSNTYNVVKLGLYNVVHVQCNSMGAHSPGSSILTAINAIETWNPDAIIMVGIAYGKDQKIGDVLISRSVIDYESVKYNSTAEKRGLHVNAGLTLVNRFSQIIDWNFNIDGHKANKETGAILSGEVLMNNAEKKKELFDSFPFAIGGDMESFGLYSACKEKGIEEWIMIKGVSDLGDGNKDDNKKQNQEIAAKSAVSLCKKVFSKKQVFDDIRINPNRSIKKLNW